MCKTKENKENITKLWFLASFLVYSHLFFPENRKKCFCFYFGVNHRELFVAVVQLF